MVVSVIRTAAMPDGEVMWPFVDFTSIGCRRNLSQKLIRSSADQVKDYE